MPGINATLLDGVVDTLRNGAPRFERGALLQELSTFVEDGLGKDIAPVCGFLPLSRQVSNVPFRLLQGPGLFL